MCLKAITWQESNKNDITEQLSAENRPCTSQYAAYAAGKNAENGQTPSARGGSAPQTAEHAVGSSLLGLAVLLVVLIFAFRHLISTPQQAAQTVIPAIPALSATGVKQVAKAVNVYQSVMYYQPVVQKYAEQNGIPEYGCTAGYHAGGERRQADRHHGVLRQRRIAQRFTRGGARSAGLHLFCTPAEQGQIADCDLDCIIQAYNCGSGFLDYAAKFNGVYSTELAEKFAEKQSGGNTIQYDNPMAVQENGGWRYATAAMFYARLVKAVFDRVIVFYALFGQNYLTNRL